MSERNNDTLPPSSQLAGWRLLTDDAREAGRVLLLWEPFGDIKEHIELGRWSPILSKWVNTYGKAFSSAPHRWSPLAPYPPSQHVVATVPCPCTLIEQDEDCPVGYPSLLCGVCNGQGHTTQEQVTAIACEMIKIASDVGEPDDPFAAWESVGLLQSQNEKMRKALEPFAKYAGDPSHIKQRAFLQLLICPLGDDHPDNHIPYFQAARAALSTANPETKP